METPADQSCLTPCPVCGADTPAHVMDIALSPQQADHLGVDLFPLVKCGACGLLYLNPRPSDALLDFYYSESEQSQEFMNQFMIAPEGNQVKYWDTALDRLAALNRGPGRLLDVGCGAGWLIKRALERGWDAHGMDSSRILSAAAMKLCPGRVRDSAFDPADYREGEFDVVTMFETLEHVTDPNQIFAGVSRVLKPGGIVAVSVPDADSIFFKLYGKRWRLVVAVGHLVYYARPQLNELLMRHGLRAQIWTRPEFDGRPLSARFVEVAKFAARAAIGLSYYPLYRFFIRPVLGKPDWSLRLFGKNLSHKWFHRFASELPCMADSIRVYAVKKT